MNKKHRIFGGTFKDHRSHLSSKTTCHHAVGKYKKPSKKELSEWSKRFDLHFKDKELYEKAQGKKVGEG